MQKLTDWCRCVWCIFSKSSQTGCHVDLLFCLLGKIDITVSPHSWEGTDPFHLNVYSWSSVVYQLHCKYTKYIIWLYMWHRKTHTQFPSSSFFMGTILPHHIASVCCIPITSARPDDIQGNLTSHMKQDIVSGMMHTHRHNMCTEIQKNTHSSFSLQQ